MLTRIVYVVFEPTGGMRHYAESLSSAMSSIADSRLVGPGVVEEFCALDHKIITKLTRRYNPRYYRLMADAIVKKYKPEVVHITSSSIGLAPFIARLRQHNIEIVYTIHDPVPHGRMRRLWGGLVEWYIYSIQMPWILTKCSAIHVHTRDHVEVIRRKYGDRCAEKLYPVQHGGGVISAILTGTARPDEWKDDPEFFTFLFFGRIEPYKGLGVLLSAFEKLVSITPQCRLVIAGAGPIEKNIRLPARQCTLINRFIRDSEIKCILEGTSVVVLPYVSATQSGVIPLAYEFARPVICSDVGGMPELVVPWKTGLIVPPGDVNALADAMKWMAVNRADTRKMGDAAKVYMAEHFSWKTIARQHCQKYAALLMEKKGMSCKALGTHCHAN